jgi:CRP-like cAMP-binding protein
MVHRLIPEMTDEEATKLESFMEQRFYPRGGIIFEQFQFPEGFYFITLGRVRLFKMAVVAKSLCALQLDDMEAYDGQTVLLGESSVLLDSLHDCTVVAATEVEACFLPIDAFRKIHTEDARLTIKLLEYMGKTISFRYQNSQEKLESRVMSHSTNPHSALALLQKYVGHAKVCTPNMAKKLFGVEDGIL